MQRGCALGWRRRGRACHRSRGRGARLPPPGATQPGRRSSPAAAVGHAADAVFVGRRRRPPSQVDAEVESAQRRQSSGQSSRAVTPSGRDVVHLREIPCGRSTRMPCGGRASQLLDPVPPAVRETHRHSIWPRKPHWVSRQLQLHEMLGDGEDRKREEARREGAQGWEGEIVCFAIGLEHRFDACYPMDHT